MLAATNALGLGLLFVCVIIVIFLLLGSFKVVKTTFSDTTWQFYIHPLSACSLLGSFRCSFYSFF